MKKKRLQKSIITVVLTAAMVMGAVPIPGSVMTAWAAEVLPEADEGTITLTEDVTLSADWEVNENIILNTAGHKLEMNTLKITIPAGKTLTVNGTIWVNDGNTLTIEGSGTLNVNGADGTTEDGVGTFGSAGVKYANSTNMNLIVEGATVNIKGGKGGNNGENVESYTNYGGYGVSLGNKGNLTVESGTVTITGGDGGDGAVAAGCGARGLEGSLTVKSGIVSIKGGNAGNRGKTGPGNEGGRGLYDNPSYIDDNYGSISVTGGTVKITGGDGSGGKVGGIGVDAVRIFADGGSLTINGGSGATGVSCYDTKLRGGILKASSFDSREMTVKVGLAYSDGTNVYSGTLTNDQKAVVADKTLYPVYGVIIADSTGGTVTASPAVFQPDTFSSADKTVTLTITPDASFELSTLTVTKASGGEVTLNGTGNTRTFTMPDENVTVSATFTQPGISYIDASGTEQNCTEYTVLTGGGATTLSAGWNVVPANTTVNYTGALTLGGDTNIILCDGATLNIGTDAETGRINGNCINGGDTYSLNVYKQSSGTGKLNAYSKSENAAIKVKDLTVYGGGFTASSTDCYAIDGNVNIKGGNFHAETTGPNATHEGISGNISLDYTSKDDTFYATGWTYNNMTIATGKAFTDGHSNWFLGKNNNGTGKTLYPAVYVDTFTTPEGGGMQMDGSRVWKLSDLTASTKAKVKVWKNEEGWKPVLTLTKATGGTIPETDITCTGPADYDNKTYTFEFIMPPENLKATATFRKLLGHTDIAIGNISSQTYSGSAITPEVTVKDGYSKTLTKGTDYTLAYSDNVDVGTATVTVTGIGDYAGTATKTFNIDKADATCTAPTAKVGLTYTGVAQELVNAGSTSDGDLYYALGTGAGTAPTTGWRTSIPTATNAGTYYVWYKVVGDKNHNDKAAASVDGVTIGKVSSDTKTIPAVEVQPGADVETKVGIGQYTGDLAELASDPGYTTAGDITFSDITLNNDILTFKTNSTEGGSGTITLTIKSSDYDSLTLTVPVTVKAKTTQVVMESGTAGTPVSGVEVNGLSEYTNTQTEDSVNVVLHATPRTEGEMPDKTKAMIDSKISLAFKGFGVGEVTTDYLDLSITKKTGDGGPHPVTDLGRVVEIAVHYDLTGKSSPVVTREHGGEVTVFDALNDRAAEGAYTDGTFYADTRNNVIYIYSSLFSVFGVTTTNVENHTVYFDPNGGSDVAPRIVKHGQPIGELPTCTRSGYSLNGWTAEPAGVVFITPEEIINEDRSFHAQWSSNPAPGPGPAPASCTHEETELRNVREATCTQEGYTGDEYCKNCGSMLTTGSIVPIDPDNHSYDEGIITTEPTMLAEGIRTYTCSRCGHTYTEAIPRTDGGKISDDLISDITDEEGKNDAKIETEDKDGRKETTVRIGDVEIEKTVTDPESGKEIVESKIWTGGLESSYTYTGSAIKPEIHVYDGTKRLAEKTDYKVTYKNNKDVGKAQIELEFKGNYKATKSEKIGFEIVPAVFGKDIVAHDVAVKAKKSAQKPKQLLTWVSTGEELGSSHYTVTYDGEESVTAAGEYTANIEAKGPNFAGKATAKVTLVGDDKQPLSDAKVTFEPKTYAYTGDAIIPGYTLKLKGKTLTKGEDYEVSSGGIYNNTSPGTATILFEGKGDYVGTKSANFKITGNRNLKEPGDGSPFTYIYPDSVPYVKGGAKPSVTVKDNGTILKAGVDYTLSYEKNRALTNGKTAVIKVKGKGNYKGTITLYFAIDRQDISKLTATADDQFGTRDKLKKPDITVLDTDGKKLKENTDYTLDQARTYTGDNDSGTVTVKVIGKGCYEGEKEVTFRYTKDSSKDIAKAKKDKNIPDQYYTGGEVRLNKSDLTDILYMGSSKSKDILVPGEDFTVTGYKDNVKKGTAKVTLTGKGRCYGTKTITFKIVAKPVDYKGELTDGKWK